MALFGNRSDFAIEAGVELDGHTEGTVWGHMCLWCAGFPLGDLDKRYCGIAHAYDELRWRALQYGELWGDELASLDDLGQLNFLDDILYGYCDEVELPETPELMTLQSDNRWTRFNFLTNWGEQFDGYKSFLVCPPGEPIKILSRAFPESARFAVSVPRQGFVTAINGFSNWFEAESHRLGVPCKSDSSVED